MDVREILLKLLGKETVSAVTKKAADGMGKFGDAAEDAAADAKKLDKQLADTERQIGDVVKALAKDPGDIGLRKQLRALERESKALGGLRDRLGKLGEEGAEELSVRFGARIGPLIGAAPISPPIIGAIASAAPAVAGIISAAVAGGAAAGAVGIGAKLVANRKEVESALADTGREIMEALTIDAGPIAEPLVEATEMARAEFRKLRPEIQGTFADAAQYVGPLSRGLAGLGRELVPGLRESVREARPVVDVLEYKLPAAGRATSNMLKMVTEDSENAAQALSMLGTAGELGLQSVGVSVGLLNKSLPFLAGHLMLINEKLTENQRKEAEAAEAAEKLAQEQARAAQAVARSAEEIDALNRALAEAPGEALSAEQAMLQFEQSIADTNETIKENGESTDVNSQKYRDNKAALLDIAAGAQSAAEATRTQTGSQEAANRVLDRGRTAFLAAAKAAGIEADEAQNLADKLFGIPGQRTTKINVNKQQAEKDLASINAKANHAARTRNLRILATYTNVNQSGALGAVGQLREKGGPVRANEAYIVGEKRAEVFVPDQDGMIYPSVEQFNRSHGYTGGGGSAGARVTVGFAAGSNLEREILRMIRFEVETNGGSGRVLGIRT